MCAGGKLGVRMVMFGDLVPSLLVLMGLCGVRWRRKTLRRVNKHKDHPSQSVCVFVCVCDQRNGR